MSNCRAAVRTGRSIGQNFASGLCGKKAAGRCFRTLLLGATALVLGDLASGPTPAHAACADPTADGQSIFCSSPDDTDGWDTLDFDNLTLNVPGPSLGGTGSIDATGAPGVRVSAGSDGTTINVSPTFGIPGPASIGSDTRAIVVLGTNTTINIDPLMVGAQVISTNAPPTIDLLNPMGDVVTINNGGLIQAGVNAAIRGTLGQGALNLDNLATGTIQGNLILGAANDTINSSGMMTGDVATGQGDDMFTNNAGASLTGELRMGGGTDTAINDGTITGLVNLGTGPDTLTNRGTITGNVVASNGGDTITNTGTGTINGNVDLGPGGDLFRNTGTTNGDVLAGLGNDRVINRGNITGMVDMGAGDDDFAAFIGSAVGGMIDGGADEDVLRLNGNAGADTFALGQAVNFETLQKNGTGTWTVTGTNAFATSIQILDGTLNVGNGATANLGTPGPISMTGSTLNVNAGSSLQGLSIVGSAGVETITVRGTLTTTNGTALAAGNDSVTITGTGRINGPLRLGGGNDFSQITGVLDGLLNAGAGNDQVILRGEITGDVDMSTGDDLFALFVGATLGAANILQGGAGIDTLRLNGAAGNDTLNLDNLRNFENLQKNGASVWNLVNTGNFNTSIQVLAGTLNVGDGATATMLTTGGPIQMTGSTLNVLANATTSGLSIVGSAGNETVTVDGTLNLTNFASFAAGMDMVTVNGTLNGELRFGGDADTFNLTGTQNGNVLLGGGVDTAAIQDGTLNGDTDGGGNAGDMLTFTTTGTTTYNFRFTNYDTFVKNGAGELILGGMNAANMSTVATGTLTVLGSIAGMATVNGGALLQGTGAVTDLVNNGAVGPGRVAGGNMIGTFTVTNTYTQNAGGAFNADIEPGGTNDLLAITGIATLDGTLNLNPLPGAYTAGQTFTVLTAGGGVAGTFATENTAVPGFLTQVAYNPNDVTIRLATAPAVLLAQGGLTPNQRSTLNNISKNLGGLFNTAFQLGLLTPAQLNAALDQLQPEVFDAYITGNLALMQLFGRTVNRRAQTLRRALALYNSNGTPSASRAPRLLADAGGTQGGMAMPGGYLPVLEPGRINLWASAIGGYAHLDSSFAHLGYSATNFGGLVGADVALTRRIVVGVLGGGGNTDIDFSGETGTGEADNLAGGVYAAWLGDRLFANGSIVYSHNWQRTSRNVAFGAVNRTARSKTTGDQLAVQGEVGRAYRWDQFVLEPIFGLDYVRLNQNAFTETGAGTLALSVSEKTAHSLRGRIELRTSLTVQHSETLAVVPELRIGYAREFLDFDRSFDAQFAGAATQFTVHGARPGRNIATVGAGIGLHFSYGLSLFAEYRGEFSSNRSFHGGNAGVRVSW